jgi:hypothetical protein
MEMQKMLCMFSLEVNCVEMDVEQLEAEAKATAAKHVINMLQRPGQLEKASHRAFLARQHNFQIKFVFSQKKTVLLLVLQ